MKTYVSRQAYKNQLNESICKIPKLTTESNVDWTDHHCVVVLLFVGLQSSRAHVDVCHK